jgi:hypothetical protein
MIVKNSFSPKFSNHGGYGYFYFSYIENDEYNFYNEKELEFHKNKLATLLNNEGKGTMKKVLYVGKASNIPRHKIKAFILENKIKKTSLIESSDTVIFDKKIIGDVYDWFNKSKLQKVAIIPFTQKIAEGMIKVNDNYLLKTGRHPSVDLKNKFKNKENIIIYENEWNSFTPDVKAIFGNLTWETNYEQSSYRVKNLKEIYNTLEYYFQNPHGNIIWDDVVLDTLNNDGIDLDNDYLDSLNSMFNSGDKGNIQLALEMLNNVNLEKYGLTVALLLNKYKDITNWGTGNTSNSAFKTLDRYFINKGIVWKSDFRTFSTGLYKNYSQDEEAKKIIELFILENINSFLGEGGFRLDGRCLQIDSFKISLKNK